MATQVTLNSGSVDSAGSLALKTNGTTTAVTINSSQGVEFNAGTAAAPSITTTGDTNTGIFFPAADTIAFSEGGAEAMRINSSGNVGIGTSSPSAKLHTQIGSGLSTGVKFLNGGSSGLQFYTDSNLANADAFIESPLTGVAMIFKNSGSERMRIDSSGNLLVGTTTSSVTTAQGIVLNPSSGFLANNSTTEAVISLILLYSSYSTADQTKFEVTSDGSVKSRTNSYAGFSDSRLKQGITPASTQWNDIKNIEVVKFQMKSEQFSDAENPWMLGVIAQQVEQVSPGLVDEDVKDGMKTVKYSILYMKAVKALQEAMERIEQLETRITALEGA